MYEIILTFDGEPPKHCGDCPLFEIERWICHGNGEQFRGAEPYNDPLPDNCPAHFEPKGE